jgi:flavin-dependent dehydrogenase
MRVDVAIAGAGPAGSACAISLRQRVPSLSVALIEASRFDLPRHGETLSPAARPLLDQLGVFEEFRAAGHAEAHGTAAAWGDASLQDNDFLFLARGPGWHLDRTRFDAMLAGHAATRGATLLLGTAIRGARRGAEEWDLDLGGHSVTARFLVDATGNAAVATRFCGARAVAFDRLVSFGKFFEDRTAADPRTIVETFADGWWYTAALPGQRRFVACMTDSAVARRLRLRDAASWTRQLEAMPFVGRIACAAHDSAPIVARACGSQRLDAAAGADWIAAGDAASRFDPLSSQGITKALRCGVFASYAIADHLGGDTRGLRRYQRFIRSEFDAYLRTRAKVYGDERRWPQSEFWRARSA